MRRLLHITLAVFLTAIVAVPTYGSLATSFVFNGNGNWSIDAVGNTGNPVGNLDAVVPVGSTVVKAFLYSSTFFNSSPPSFTPTVNFDGTVISGASWSNLGLTSACCGLVAFRTDVTAQVAAKIGGGSAVPFTFNVLSESPQSTNAGIDGEVLAIIYSNPGDQERTIAFLDGFSATTGDSTSVNLASALTAPQLADPNFEALLSLGIGFSTGGTQSSNVDVNGNRLTSAAGGFDDGSLSNSALITAGGIGDSPTNPANPLSTASPDDELYTLEPFLNVGDTSITIRTLNPSNDDNIFFAGINITAVAGVNEPPPTAGVPEPASLLVWSLGLAAAGATLYKKRKS